MLDSVPGRAVWLIDRRKYWREPFARALRKEGFDVAKSESYVRRPRKFGVRARSPDLVVLACTAVTKEEVEFVRRLTAQDFQVLVLVAALSPDAMRELFLAGAYDVLRMPVREDRFVHLIFEAMNDAKSSREHRAAALAGL